MLWTLAPSHTPGDDRLIYSTGGSTPRLVVYRDGVEESHHGCIPAQGWHSVGPGPQLGPCESPADAMPGDWKIVCADALAALGMMPDESVNCVVTSPPYWGLRDYGVDGQLGLESSPHELVDRLVEIFREVRRVLRSDGTCWINLGDTYIAGRTHTTGSGQVSGRNHMAANAAWKASGGDTHRRVEGLKAKDMVGFPWRLALALQDDGWWLRSEIIWHKPNPLPESVRDRPTRTHEHLFLLTKSRRYYYDQDATREPCSPNSHPRGSGIHAKARKANTDAVRAFGSNRGKAPRVRQNESFSVAVRELVETRNARTVWSIATQPRGEDHFAAYPDELPRRCIAAGCPEGGLVLDPFVGRGTTAIVALRLGRRALGIDLSPEYCQMAARNIERDAPLFNRPIVEES